METNFEKQGKCFKRSVNSKPQKEVSASNRYAKGCQWITTD